MIIEGIGNAERNTLSTLYTTLEAKDYPSSPETFPDPPHDIVEGLQVSTRALDIGCSYGYLGYWLKNNKDISADGIDINRNALNYNKQTGIYDKTYLINLDNLRSSYRWKTIKNQSYKYIFLLDVLEHLKDPGDSLQCIVDKLEFDGEVLISLPNVGHIDIVLGLLQGKFNYNQFGLLDETHLRFFTIGSFSQFIENLNEDLAKQHTKLILKKLGHNTKSTEAVEAFKKKNKKFYDEAVALGNEEDLFTVQYFISLKKIKI